MDELWRLLQRPVLIAIALVLVAGVGSFFAARALDDSSVVTAQGDVLPVGDLADPEITAQLQIDTIDPNWDVPYWQEWQAKPRYDQALAGIRIGPTVEVERSCESRELIRAVDPSMAKGTALEISPRYLPAGAVLAADPSRTLIGSTLACGDTLILNDAKAGIPAADNAEERRTAGESWFQIPHGGFIEISRISYATREHATPAIGTDIPGSHWEERQVGSRIAAVGRPVLDAGLGPAELYSWNPDTRVLTQILSIISLLMSCCV